MSVFPPALFSRFLLLVLVAGLSACASWAPGMRMDAQVAGEAAAANVTPVVHPITPDLIRQEKAMAAQEAGTDVSALLGEPQPYVIGNGDLLSIVVWNHPELSIASSQTQALTGGAQVPAGFAVDHHGMVQYPYIGPVRLAGLTELEARNLLTERLVKVIKSPDITLRVQAFRSKRVYVDGDVKAPGNQVIDDVPMTLLEAVTRAGGFLPTADQSRILVNRSGQRHVVNLPALVRKGIDPSRILLADGDVVRVSPRDETKIFVMGEVTRPVALPMQNGRLTLNQALGEAGGPNPLSSEASQVYVIRNANADQPQVYHLDARSPVALALAENFDLQPQDVVYVDASSLARFHRVISLILPSASAAVSSYGTLGR